MARLNVFPRVLLGCGLRLVFLEAAGRWRLLEVQGSRIVSLFSTEALVV